MKEFAFKVNFLQCSLSSASLRRRRRIFEEVEGGRRSFPSLAFFFHIFFCCCCCCCAPSPTLSLFFFFFYGGIRRIWCDPHDDFLGPSTDLSLCGLGHFFSLLFRAAKIPFFGIFFSLCCVAAAGAEPAPFAFPIFPICFLPNCGSLHTCSPHGRRPTIENVGPACTRPRRRCDAPTILRWRRRRRRPAAGLLSGTGRKTVCVASKFAPMRRPRWRANGNGLWKKLASGRFLLPSASAFACSPLPPTFPLKRRRRRRRRRTSRRR